MGTAIPSAFISEASIAPMFLPIAMALYTLTSKKIGDAPQLGKLLMMSIAIGCMVGAPMSPTGGARNAIMIGFLGNLGPEYEISFMQWMILGSFYTFFLGLFFAFLLPLLYKPEVDDLSDAVNTLREDLPNFKAGDELSIYVNVREGQKVRQQLFKGTVIGRKGSGIAETITVRKISNGIGVERIFPLHSPSIASIKVDRVNKVRRAKLYYLRGLSGKAARLAEKK